MGHRHQPGTTGGQRIVKSMGLWGPIVISIIAILLILLIMW